MRAATCTRIRLPQELDTFFGASFAQQAAQGAAATPWQDQAQPLGCVAGSPAVQHSQRGPAHQAPPAATGAQRSDAVLAPANDGGAAGGSLQQAVGVLSSLVGQEWAHMQQRVQALQDATERLQAQQNQLQQALASLSLSAPAVRLHPPASPVPQQQQNQQQQKGAGISSGATTSDSSRPGSAAPAALDAAPARRALSTSAAAASGHVSKLTHVDDSGRAAMVDVAGKQHSAREARASCAVLLGEEAYRLVASNQVRRERHFRAGLHAARVTSGVLLGKEACQAVASTQVRREGCFRAGLTRCLVASGAATGWERGRGWAGGQQGWRACSEGWCTLCTRGGACLPRVAPRLHAPRVPGAARRWPRGMC